MHRSLQVTLLFAFFSVEFSPLTIADPYPPEWDSGAGSAVHYAPVAWPSEPANPADCNENCGSWKPYTRFQNDLADARYKDESNGGTTPQSYVNVASSCEDRSLPSIYYYMHQGATEAEDVLMFRWRVEAAAHNYATGPNAGNFSATNPWSSALWTVFFDVDGSGFRTLAAHLDGSSGAPATAIDRLAGIWGESASHSLDYVNDPNVHLLGHNPTAFIGSTSKILNFQDSLTPVETWPNGSAETSWDYGSSRAKRVSQNSCTEYFVDYQIPIAMLDASAFGGPKITRETPIAMMFCTANSLNNPLQKDCAVQKSWLAGTGTPAPFGDYLSFNQTEPYSQPIIAEITAQAPSSCPGSYTLQAKVQDTLALQNGTVISSVKSVEFFYWLDVNGDGEATSDDTSSEWVKLGDASLKSGSLNLWQASWDATGLAKGKYLIAAQAVDDYTLIDDGMVPSGRDNRTFSYLSGDAANTIYVDGSWATAQEASFPTHNPSQTPDSSENWYGNPGVTGSQYAVVGTAINACGVAPTISQSVSQNELNAGETTTLTITIANPANNSESVSVSSIESRLPTGFSYVASSSTGASSTDPTAVSQLLTWTLVSPVNLSAGANTSLSFDVTAASSEGYYNNQATAETSFGTLEAAPVAIAVAAARVGLSIVPDSYSVAADSSDTVTFTVTATNTSAVSVQSAEITAAVTSPSFYVSCTGGLNCSESGGTITWQLADLTAGASTSVSYTISVADTWPSSSLTSTANFSASDSAANPVSSSATATVAVTGLSFSTPAAFSFSKTASAIQVAPGASVTYTLNYENYGGTAATSVELTDELPEGLTFTSCTGSCVHSSGTVTWSLGTVNASTSGSVSVTVAYANPFTAPNPVVNTANLSWSGGSGASASNNVGVTGEACADYWFSDSTGDVGFDGTRQLAVLSPEPTSGDTGISVIVTAPSKSTATYVEALRFYQDPATSSDVPFSGDITTTIYIDRANGNALNLRASVYDYNSTTGDKTLLGQNDPLGDGQFGGSEKGALSVVVPTTGTLAKNHRLLWIFEAQSNHNSQSYDVQFQYGGTVANNFSSGSTIALSGANFCVTPPANLVLNTVADTASLSEGSTSLVTYTIGYANTGSVDATNAVLLADLPSGFTNCEYSLNNSSWATCSDTGTPAHSFSLSTVLASASGSVYLRGNAPAASVGGSTLTQTATIGSDQTSDLSAQTLIDVTSAAASGSAELAVTLVADKQNLVPGQSITYTATVINIGSASASDVALSNQLPVADYFTYDSCTGGCNIASDTLTWAIGSLAAGASASVTFTLQAGSTNLSAGTTLISDDLTASGTAVSDATSDEVTIALSGNPQLQLSKSASPSSGLSPGDVFTYTLNIENTGAVTANEVQLLDPIPANTQYAAALTASTGSATFDTVNNQVIWTLSTLAAGASASLSWQASVPELASGTTTLVNNATVTAANAGSTSASANASASASASFSLGQSQQGSSAYPAATLTASVAASTSIPVDFPSNFSIGQLVQIDGGVYTISAIRTDGISLNNPLTATSGAAIVGAVTYSINYSHTGDAEATGAVLTQTLPSGINFYSVSPTADSTPSVGSSGDIEWQLGDVAVGASQVFEVVAFPASNGLYTITASLSSTNASTVTASVDTAVGGIRVSKTTSTPQVQAGDVASYTITLSNSLTSTINNISVQDVLPQGFSYKTGSALVGGSAEEPSFDGSDTDYSQPEWTSLSVLAGGSLSLQFDADVNASTGKGVYQNELVVSTPVGVGLQSFDALSTTVEDVTVLAADEAVLTGTVFYRSGQGTGAYVAGTDTTLANVQVEIYQSGETCSGFYANCYITFTNGDGTFEQILPAGDWYTRIVTGTGDLDAGWTQTVGSNDVEQTYIASSETTLEFGFTSITGIADVVDFAITTDEDTAYDFALSDFNAAFTDAWGGSDLHSIVIASLPAQGTLTLNSVAVSANDTISSSDISLLSYLPATDYNGSDSFAWNGSDGFTSDATNAAVNITINPVADPSESTITDISKTTDEDVALIFAESDFTAVLNDSSGGQNLVRIRIESLPSNGTLTLNASAVALNDLIEASDIANLVYTPTADYYGSDSFDWNAYDGSVWAAINAAVNITINSVADSSESTISDINKTTDEDVALTFAESDFTAVLNDSAGGQNLVRIRIESLPANGALTLYGLPVNVNDELSAVDIAYLVYTPSADYYGSDSFDWTSFDGVVWAQANAAVVISINSVVDANEISLADIYKTLDEDTTLTFNYNDFANAFTNSDGGNAWVRIRIESLPQNGVLSLASNPVALNDEITVADVDQLTYSPAADYNGQDQFTWNVWQGTVWAATPAQVLLTINPVADLGEVTVVSFARELDEDTSLSFNAADFTDNTTDGLGGNSIDHIRIDSLPGNGQLTLAGNPVTANATITDAELANLVYTPEANYNGADSFSWNAWDGTAYATYNAEVTLTIQPVADDALATNLQVTTTEDTALIFTLADFTSHYQDTAGGQALTELRIDSLPSQGELSLAGSPVSLNQVLSAANIAQLQYTPAANFNGGDSFSWDASDGIAWLPQTAMVEISVSPAADAPSVSSFSLSLEEDATLTFSAVDFTNYFSDADGDALSAVQVLSLPNQGTLRLSGNPVELNQVLSFTELANLSYQPNSNQTGSDSFNWTANDGQLWALTPAAVQLTITAVNDAPVLGNVILSTAEDTALALNSSQFTAQFADTEGDALTTVQVLSLPSHGHILLAGNSVVVNQNFSLGELNQLLYVPEPDYTGADQWLWQAYDGSNWAVASAEVNITVTPVNDTPAISSFAVTLDEDTLFSFTDEFANNFSDPEGEPLAMVNIVQLPTGGQLLLNGQAVTAGQSVPAATIAQLVYQPNQDQNGSDLLLWNGSDGTTYAPSSAEVAITIAPVADAGSAVNIAKRGPEGQSLLFTKGDFTNAFTPGADGNVLTQVRINTLPTPGQLRLGGKAVTAQQVLSLNELAKLTYQPTVNFVGNNSFEWAGFDGAAWSNNANVLLTITGINRGPNANNGEVSTPTDEPITVNVLEDASDPDGDQITLLRAEVSFGSVSIVNNELVYTPPPKFSGDVEVRYLVADGQGGFTEATLLVHVLPSANAPSLEIPSGITVDAKALYTKVDLGVASAFDRFGNPLPVSLVDAVTFFEPGVNRAFWRTEDADGYIRMSAQEVLVRPLVSIAKDQSVLEGESAQIQVYLNGPSPTYPLTIGYTVSGTAGVGDHDLITGEIVLNSGMQAAINVQTIDDGELDSDETLIVTLDSQLNLGSHYEHTLTIIEGNLSPDVDIITRQNGTRRLLISRELNEGLVVMQARAIDPNRDDELTYNWLTPVELGGDLDTNPATFTFDPAMVNSGLYEVEVEVTDNGSPTLSDSATAYLDVVDALPVFDPDGDDDMDLTPNSVEGLGDDDGDGIPNYLDARDECNVLFEALSDNDAYAIEGDPGVCLRKGYFTVQGESGGAQVTAQDVGIARNGIIADDEADNVGGIFDFISYGLPVAGQLYRIVLPQRLPIPANAVYRKFQNGSWGFFVETGEESIASAPGEMGYCPPPGASDWQPGLNPGHWCVQLSLRDGGPNDDDGIANGVVVDPGGVGVMKSINQAPVAMDFSVNLERDSVLTLDVLAAATDADNDTLSLLTANASIGSVSIGSEGQLLYTPPVGYLGAVTIQYSISDGRGGVNLAEVVITVAAPSAAPTVTQPLRTRGGGAITWYWLLILGLFTSRKKWLPLAGVLLGVFKVMAVQAAPLDESNSEQHTQQNEVTKANASDFSGWYMQGGLGNSSSRASFSGLQTRFDDANLAANVLVYDGHDVAWQLGLGYRWQNGWALAVGYSDLGEFVVDFEGQYTEAEADAYFAEVAKLHPEAAKGFYLALNPHWYFTEHWYAAPTVGVYRWQADYSTQLIGGSQVSTHKTQNTDLFYGLAIGRTLTERLRVQGEWQAYHFINHDADVFALTLQYRFNSSDKPPKLKPIVDLPVEPMQEAPVEEPPAISEAQCALFDGALAGVNFETNSAQLKASAIQTLLEAAKVLNQFANLHILIAAHTDSRGSDSANLALSEARAKSVLTFFIEQGIEQQRLSDQGFGETQPVADNNTAEGRALNRRVELQVVEGSICP